MSNNIAIEALNITKKFADLTAVNQLSFVIPKGCIFGILGANGSGKTTIFKMLSGLLQPDQGHIMCLGLNAVSEREQVKVQLGYMPQYFCLYKHLTVYENLDFIARIYGLKNRKQKLSEILDLLILTDKQNQLSGTLSGGWQKRLALGAALLHQPRILLLDEPTSGLDPHSRLVIWKHIQDLAATGVTIVVSTHYMDEAERCHQLAYLASGRLIISGSTYEIIQYSGLNTWSVMGSKSNAIKIKLRSLPFAVQVIEKGHELRVSSKRADIWHEFKNEELNSLEVTSVKTTLEDAFIFEINHQETL